MATHFLNLIPPLPMGNHFPIPPSQYSILPTPSPSAPQQAQTLRHPPLPTFRAPAHKHAHHLHSIPPREKSTRTLIIDHMLWVHARTRFAQARAELGMTDPTGGPSSPNYSHRRRPENYDEDEQALSEGEDLLFLKARPGWPGSSHDDDDADHLSKQDLALARSLRLRAEGLESVASSMLDQPPPQHPTDNDSPDPTPSPPKGSRTGLHPHTLPNGVRLRLALGTIVNDLFARQAPPQPYRHTHPPKPHEESHSHHPHNFIPGLPESLTPLVLLSGVSIPTQEAHYPPTPSLPYNLPTGYTTRTMNTTHCHTHPRSPVYNPRPIPSSRTILFYTSGADPSTANSPPSLRCPRHLHTGCEICVEAKPLSNRTSTHHQHSKGGTSKNSNSNQWKSEGVGGGLSGWQSGGGVGSGLLRPGIKGSALRRCVYDNAIEEGDKSTGTGNTKLSKLIPRFLRLSALVAAELGQEARDNIEWEIAGGAMRPPPSPVTTDRTIPSNYARGKEREGEGEDKNMFDHALHPTREWYMLLAGLLTRAVLEGYLTAGWRGIKPTECLLLVGIGISRIAAPGGIGGRIHTENGRADEEETVTKGCTDGSDDEDDDSKTFGDEQEFAEFDPDGLPSLSRAIKILFPSLKSESDTSSSTGRDGRSNKGHAELEYEMEMYERLKRFYDIPESTPDLSTHMEDLAWSYPAEPVERAALRFCEAVAKWRGKPELETYKKKSPSSPGMSINTFVHSNPSSPVLSNASVTTPYSLSSLGSMLGQPPQSVHSTPAPRRQVRKPTIDVYFYGVSARVGTKRGRDERDVEGREEGVKRMRK